MDILMPTIGSAGDVLPVLRLGKSLSNRGHQITVLANRTFEAEVLQVGLHFVPISDEETYNSVVLNPDLWNPNKAFPLIVNQFILPAIQPMLAAIRQFDPKNSLILSCGFCFAARIAQEKWGYRNLTIHLQPAVLQSAYEPPRLGGLSFPDWLPVPLTRLSLQMLDRFLLDKALAPEINRIRQDLLLTPVERIYSHWMHSLTGVIGLFPEWFAPPQSDWPANTELTGFIGNMEPEQGLSEDLKDFLDAGEAPILFTPGTSMQFANSFFEESIKTCQLLGCRGVFVTQSISHVPLDLSRNILFVSKEPFERLLPRCLAIVYHGGIGTLAQAIKAGIPQLVVPFSHDQPDNASRIKRLGVGDWISPKHYHAKPAARKLEKLLESLEVSEVTHVVDTFLAYKEYDSIRDKAAL